MARSPLKFECAIRNLAFKCFPIYNLISTNEVGIIQQICASWKDHCFQTDKVVEMNSSKMVQNLSPFNSGVLTISREMQSREKIAISSDYA